MGYLVRLKPNWPGNFRRSIRQDPDSGEQVLQGGKIVGVMEFAPGEVAELSDEEYHAVAADIDVALENVELDDKGRPRACNGPYQVPDKPAGRQSPSANNQGGNAGDGDGNDPPEEPNEIPGLDLPPQVAKALISHEIKTREAVVAYVESGNALTDIKGIGPPSAEAILAALQPVRDPSETDNENQ